VLAATSDTRHGGRWHSSRLSAKTSVAHSSLPHQYPCLVAAARPGAERSALIGRKVLHAMPFDRET
jgi:hypothetical protein